MGNYLDVANGGLMGILCVIVILFVLIQAFIFIRKAWRRGTEIGLQHQQMKKVITNSVAFSIMPSLPILAFLLMLMPTLGRFFPWLRLSVIGSGAYENLVANMTAQLFGLENVSDAGMNATIFLGIMWAMTLGIILEPILTLFGSKFIQKGLGLLKGKNQKLLNVVMTCLMISLFLVLGAPYYTSFRNIPTVGLSAMIPPIVMIFTALCSLGLNKLATVTGKPVFKEFSFPLALISGMVVAIALSAILA
ncbi:MAG: DUF5058 family protein [Bacillota bacterium]